MRKCILMIGIQDYLSDSLFRLMNHFGYQVLPSSGAGVTSWLVAHRRFSLIVLNVEHFQAGLPELLSTVREYQQPPIVALSDNNAKRFNVDLILSTQLHPRKMAAYFIALMQRHRGNMDFTTSKPLDGWPIEQGDFFVDQILDWACVNGKSVELSPRESQLLVYFLLRVGQMLDFQTVCTALWMEMGGYGCDERTLVVELRNKIEPDPKHPVYLQSIPCGYCFYDRVCIKGRNPSQFETD